MDEDAEAYGGVLGAGLGARDVDEDEEDEDDDDEDPSDVAMVPMADMLNARYESENVSVPHNVHRFLY